jgi:hypothetical protein
MEKNTFAITYRPAKINKVPNIHGRTYVFLVRNPQYTFTNKKEENGSRIVGMTAHSSSGKIRSFRFDRIVSQVPVAG